MTRPQLGLRLMDKLGPEASQDLGHAFEEAHNDMLTVTAERFEARLLAVASELRQDMARMDAGIRVTLMDGLSKMRSDLSESRANTLYWSFAFWIAQFTATAALLGFMLRLAGR